MEVSTGAVRQMVPSSRLRYALSRPFSSFWRRLSRISRAAIAVDGVQQSVFMKQVQCSFPTPGTPGMLSLVSPIRAFESMS